MRYTRSAQSPLPGKPARDREYGVSARSTPTRPHERPDRTAPEANSGANGRRREVDRPDREVAPSAPDADTETIAEAARRTRFIKI